MVDEVCRGGSFHLPKWRIVNHFSGSWLKSSFATDRLPCGFRFWPPYNVWVRKHCDYLGTVQRNPLFVQSTYHLSYFGAFQHHSLLCSLGTVFQIVGSDLRAFLREATDKKFFPYAEVLCDMTHRKRPSFSIENFLEKLLYEKHIPF